MLPVPGRRKAGTALLRAVPVWKGLGKGRMGMDEDPEGFYPRWQAAGRARGAAASGGSPGDGTSAPRSPAPAGSSPTPGMESCSEDCPCSLGGFGIGRGRAGLCCQPGLLSLLGRSRGGNPGG